MINYFARNTAAAGFIAGIAMAACSSLLLWLNQGQSEILVTAIDFLAGLPVVFARRLDVPQPLFYLLFFAYSGFNGASIARLVRRWCGSNR
jgi:FtsH-binding integral membrane protein